MPLHVIAYQAIYQKMDSPVQVFSFSGPIANLPRYSAGTAPVLCREKQLMDHLGGRVNLALAVYAMRG